MSELNKPWIHDPTETKEAIARMIEICNMSADEFVAMCESQPPKTPAIERRILVDRLDNAMKSSISVSKFCIKKRNEPWNPKRGDDLFWDYELQIKDSITFIYKLQATAKDGTKIEEEESFTPTKEKIEMTSAERNEKLDQLFNKMTECQAWSDFIRRHTMDPFDHRQKFANYIDMLKDIWQLYTDLRISKLVVRANVGAPMGRN